MDDNSHTFSDREIESRGDTMSETISIMDAELGRGASVVNLASIRQNQTNNDLRRWISSVLPAIDEFIRLPQGWDSYSGKPLKLDTGMFALQLLYDVMNPRVPVPLVAPTSPGGVQFEWHQERLDLELCINAPYDCDLYFIDNQTGEEGSYHLTTDFSRLTRLMPRLQSARQVA